jgi:hypothetical protein
LDDAVPTAKCEKYTSALDWWTALPEIKAGTLTANVIESVSPGASGATNHVTAPPVLDGVSVALPAT